MRKGIAAVIIAAVMLVPQICTAETKGDLQSEIQRIQQQLSEMDALKARLSDLEKKLAENQKQQSGSQSVQASNTPSVSAGTDGSKIKIDGRAFIGLFGSGDQGSYPNWSTDIPDAKLRFTYFPAKNVTVVTRLNASGAKTADFDYFYLDYAGFLGASNILRFGQRKIAFGQETWVDNPVENMLISNSVSHVSGYGIGAAMLGRLKGTYSPLYEIGFVNGPKGVTARPTNALLVNATVGMPLPLNLFASASYFNSGWMGAADKSALSVAEISDAPAGASEWKRSIWEMDLRYNYGPWGIRSFVPTGKIPPLMLGATYGRFNDEVAGAPGREGDYWFAEGSIKLNPRLYTAARYSITNLDNGVLAKLGKSPAAVNSYKRTSVGLGYVLSDLVLLKLEYSINNTSGGASEPSLNQWATGVAVKF